MFRVVPPKHTSKFAPIIYLASLILTTYSHPNQPTMTAGGRISGRIFNCIPSYEPQNDWRLDKAIAEGLVKETFEEKIDRREDWWEIGDQLQTGSCVGWSSTDGILRYHLVKKGLIKPEDKLSPWLTWMAAKATDADKDSDFGNIRDGVCLKAALEVLRKHGATHDNIFEWEKSLAHGTFSVDVFAELPTKYKITSYYKVIKDNDCDPDDLRRWISAQGPVIALVDCDEHWYRDQEGTFEKYSRKEHLKKKSGHGVAIVGYDKDYFYIRNSWGTEFCDGGFVKCSNEYVRGAVCEAYGIVL